MMAQVLQIDPESFYAERDNRTNLRLAQSPEPVRLALAVAPGWAQSASGQLALYWLCSLVARMGRRYNGMRIWLPPESAGRPNLIRKIPAQNLADAVMMHLRAADPFGGYAVVDEPREGEFVVSVGDMPGEAEGLVVRPQGWSTALAWRGALPPSPPAPSDTNPVGAALAAALGAAAVYQHFNRELVPGYESQAPLWVSALHSAVTSSAEEAAKWPAEPSLPGEIDIGRWLVVGAGALGANALEILGHLTGLRGHVGVNDPDVLEISNLNRIVPALFSHLGLPKAYIAASCLQGLPVEVVPHLERYERLQTAGGDGRLPVESYDLILAGVDQMATRAFIQSDWPRLLVNAGTRGFTWRVSSHPVDTAGACVGCLAGNSQQSYNELRAALRCGGGGPQQAAEQEAPMDSYSFVSFFGAAFLAAEALKLTLGLGAQGGGDITEAVSLNLGGMRRRSGQPSERCLCRCGHPVVRQYRVGKYAGGL